MTEPKCCGNCDGQMTFGSVKGWFLVQLVLTVVAAAVFTSVGGCAMRHDMQQQAIERGFAEYDAKTGEWKWKGE